MRRQSGKTWSGFLAKAGWEQPLGTQLAAGRPASPRGKPWVRAPHSAAGRPAMDSLTCMSVCKYPPVQRAVNFFLKAGEVTDGLLRFSFSPP